MSTKTKVSDDYEVRLAAAKAFWRTLLGPDHKMSPEELNESFQKSKSKYLAKSVNMLKHLENLGYVVSKK